MDPFATATEMLAALRKAGLEAKIISGGSTPGATKREAELCELIRRRADVLLADLRLHVGLPTGGGNLSALDQTRALFTQRLERLGAKLGGQLRLGVPTSGTVGRARVVGGLFDWRKRFGDSGAPPVAPARFAVVPGPRAGVIALRWLVGTQAIPELVAVAGTPPTLVDNERVLASLVHRLAGAPASAAPPPPEILEALHVSVRARLAESGSRPDYSALVREVLGVRNAPPARA